MTRVLVLQHVACEGPGLIGEVLQSCEIETNLVGIHEGAPVPHNLDSADGLVVMGGPMGVYEVAQYPHLRDEIRLIAEAVQQNLPVLGICLGSQLLAAALDARVYPAKQKEIGWYTVELQDGARQDRLWRDQPHSFTPLHWHGDIFELPKGTVSLASSALTQHQAFRCGERAYGLLFHLEVTPQQLQRMVQAFQGELDAARIPPESILQEAETRCRQAGEIGRRVFERFAHLIVEGK